VEFLKEFDDTMEVVIEATLSWYWLYDCLEDEGFKWYHYWGLVRWRLGRVELPRKRGMDIWAVFSSYVRRSSSVMAAVA
jgi:hypothetical protein